MATALEEVVGLIFVVLVLMVGARVVEDKPVLKLRGGSYCSSSLPSVAGKVNCMGNAAGWLLLWDIFEVLLASRCDSVVL